MPPTTLPSALLAARLALLALGLAAALAVNPGDGPPPGGTRLPPLLVAARDATAAAGFTLRIAALATAPFAERGGLESEAEQ